MLRRIRGKRWHLLPERASALSPFDLTVQAQIVPSPDTGGPYCCPPGTSPDCDTCIPAQRRRSFDNHEICACDEPGPLLTLPVTAREAAAIIKGRGEFYRDDGSLVSDGDYMTKHRIRSPSSERRWYGGLVDRSLDSVLAVSHRVYHQYIQRRVRIALRDGADRPACGRVLGAVQPFRGAPPRRDDRFG